mmetsp:Transcript_35198/g.109596  ORF Transcript_35198/g.109596 Transcript_35198/m.109596 type:complete len:350 (-) Transcript_35198:144-1193(-)
MPEQRVHVLGLLVQVVGQELNEHDREEEVDESEHDHAPEDDPPRHDQGVQDQAHGREEGEVAHDPHGTEDLGDLQHPQRAKYRGIGGAATAADEEAEELEVGRNTDEHKIEDVPARISADEEEEPVDHKLEQELHNVPSEEHGLHDVDPQVVAGPPEVLHLLVRCVDHKDGVCDDDQGAQEMEDPAVHKLGQLTPADRLTQGVPPLQRLDAEEEQPVPRPVATRTLKLLDLLDRHAHDGIPPLRLHGPRVVSEDVLRHLPLVAGLRHRVRREERAGVHARHAKRRGRPGPAGLARSGVRTRHGASVAGAGAEVCAPHRRGRRHHLAGVPRGLPGSRVRQRNLLELPLLN